ncbi:hypothetical protein Scep_004479 [Stephania cephalantha]|uniref:Uncharacterized protein n=1 Tax=Stephania cephalantha TaxID=152367 RepID=A0AAP0KV16_9MAGN
MHVHRGCTCTEDAFEDVNDVHDSSNTSEPLTAPTLKSLMLLPHHRKRTTTTDGRGNEAKKKRKQFMAARLWVAWSLCWRVS